MKYKTIEIDRDGRLTVYPALKAPQRKGLRELFRRLLGKRRTVHSGRAR